MNIRCVCILLTTLGWSFGINVYSQKEDVQNPSYLAAEINLGETFDANTNFPDTKLQKGGLISLGWFHRNKDQEWSKRLNHPRTGLTLGYTDFGNWQEVGYALSLLSYLELNLFTKKSERWKLKTGLGISYLSQEFDSITNPNNRAVSTNYKWSFRSLLYYDLSKRKRTTFRVGLGLTHHSNGHTSLPNKGINSIVASVETEFMSKKALDKLRPIQRDTMLKKHKIRYLNVRTGIGQNVLSEVFNDKKEVYSLAISTGKVINSTFRLGFGVFYRVYEHYYDYISNNEQLIEDFYPYFADNPFLYASNFGLMAEGELLLGHIGAEINIGFNIFKPSYKIDWQLNEGYNFVREGEFVTILGELDSYYEIKRSIPARLGLKYYLRSTAKNPIHNLYLGAHINANLGQADFTELSLGYEYRFHPKKRK